MCASVRRTVQHRRAQASIAAGSIALLLALPLASACPPAGDGTAHVPRKGIPALPHPAPFTPVENLGLVAQISSVSAQVSLNLRQFGQGGTQDYRTISLSGTLTDLSGSRAFRIVGAPRLVHLTDELGNELSDRATWSVYPDVGNIQPFTRPDDSGGGMLQQTFSLSTNDIPHVPGRIARLRIEMDAAVGGQAEPLLLRAQVTKDFQTLAPGVEARVTRITTEHGQSNLGVEYRLTRPESDPETPDAGPRPWFFEAEVLDDEHRVLHRQQGGQEAQTQGATLGALTIWGVDTSDAPAWYIRLHIVRSSELVHLTIDERDLPLLGN